MIKLAALRDLGCDAAQGFLVARPSADPIAAGVAHARFPPMA